MMAKLMTDKTDNGLFQNRYRIPSSRASWHDYGGGVYFITICTAGRLCYFGEIADGEMRMSEIGRYTDACIRKIESLHTDISVPIYQIMPNHVHLVVIIEDITNLIKKETPQCDVSTARTSMRNAEMHQVANACGYLSHVLSRFKSAVTKYAHLNGIPFGWQARFHDRIVRNQDELNRIAEYIENNVANWNSDELNG